MNLSETAFVSKGWSRKVGSFAEKNKYTLRWFTPTQEMELCGHATLASGHVIFERMKEGIIDKMCRIIFESKFKGFLGAAKNWNTELITLDFPTCEPKLLNKTEHAWIDELVKATLGCDVNEKDVQEVLYSSDTMKLLVRLKDKVDGEERIRKVKPDFNAQMKINTNGLVRGVIITEKANFSKENVHFYSRYFAPWNGINEDPVCGSAHAVSAPYWKKEYGNELKVVVGKQCSKRGGLLHCSVNGSRVELSGRARSVVTGGELDYNN